MSVQSIPEPKELFRWFYAINEIPRCSGHEKEISDFLYRFARERGLEAEQDEALNVIIRKAAAPGYEKQPPVILQGHMDMVCEKTAESTHDFSKDPLRMIVDGDRLRADGTTLGADNGIAVACAMAILDGDYPHPALEVLVTTAEETGMDGAMALRPGQLRGKTLLNLDGEDENCFLVSCAGGAEVNTLFPAAREPWESHALHLEVKGLMGGHSGVQIGLGRANALKLIARLAQAVMDVTACRIAAVGGGSKHNAIPSFAFIDLCPQDAGAARHAIERMTATLKAEYRVSDPEWLSELSETDCRTVLNDQDARHLLDYLLLVPDGVQSMSQDIEGLVRTSLNNAILTDEGDKIRLVSSVRSSVLSSREECCEKLLILARFAGAEAEVSGGYPAWEYEAHSPIRERAAALYERLYGKKARVAAIHAGLECGLLKEALPDCDMISMGPDNAEPHTPQENLSIPSTGRFFNFLLKLLEEMKDA